MQLYQLYLARGGFDNLKLIFVELHDLIELWKTLIFMEYQTAYGHVLVALRQV